MKANATFIVSGFFLHLASIILSVYLIYQVANKRNSEDMRMLYLAGLAFQLGFLIGPAIHMIYAFHPEILTQAVLYTATAFTSFSLISVFSKRRSMLFVGSIIVTLVQGLLLYRLFGWLLGYSYMNMVYLMVGLLTACLFVIYDTQLIIEKAEHGDNDVISHTMLLFIDLFDLFVKILQILIKLKEENEEENERDKRKKK
jgi:FtsH-binding integral membrane protein